MKVLNIHTRLIKQPKKVLVELLQTLATKNDLVWPWEKWPRMKLDKQLAVGAKGGHGPIRYTVESYDPENMIVFRFEKPRGFYGTHYLELIAIDDNNTELKHVIDINTSLLGSIQWVLAIEALHDALLEDCLDKVENHFSYTNKITAYSFKVKILRKILA